MEETDKERLERLRRWFEKTLLDSPVPKPVPNGNIIFYPITTPCRFKCVFQK